MPSPRMRALLLVSGLASALALLAGPAVAQTSTASVSCPPGNLLAGRRPWQWVDMRGNIGLPTDGRAAPEGALWDASPAVILETAAAALTWDLGTARPLQALYIQADANDLYRVFGSLDGQDFRPLGQIEPVEGHGLRGRTLSLGGTPVRYLRVGQGKGDTYYSLSEVQAFCQVPTPFPPSLPIADAPAAPVATTIHTYWNNNVSARWELALAVLGGLFLLWEARLRYLRRADAHRRVRNGILATMGLLSALTYFNFGFFHFPNYVHNWDAFHYYIGAKYSHELGYDKLYECVAIADVEDGLRLRVEARKITNLRTNVLETTEDILRNPGRCRSQFTDARWTAFKKDVAFFRNRENPRRWDDAQTDHGYNGTPVWNIAGSVLSNLAPASNAQLMFLTLLDPAYFVAMCGVVWWAFGWRVLSVGLLVFATNFPSRFYWTGGSFLRWDWLFYLVAAICCLKKERYTLAGLSLGYATLLRIFPGFAFTGPLLAAGYTLVRERRLDPRYVRLFGGAALAVALLVPISLKTSNGIGAYQQFIQNTAKHKETPLTNYMGLRTVLAFRPDEVGRRLRSDKLTDPWSDWKAARVRAWKEARPAYVLCVLGALVLIGYAVRKRDPWIAAAAGVTFIPIGVELTCYYYAFVIAVALLHERDDRVGPTLLLMTAVTGFIDWRPIRQMPAWLDEQYTWMSLATIVGFGLVLSYLVSPRAAAAVEAAASSTPPTTTGSPKNKKRR
jgi:hypothetical protein